MFRVFFYIVTIGGLAGCVLFTLRYHLKTRGAWRSTEVGHFFVAVYVNLAALFAYLIVSPFLGDYRRWIALILYTLYAIQAWWPLRLLEKYGRKVKVGD